MSQLEEVSESGIEEELRPVFADTPSDTQEGSKKRQIEGLKSAKWLNLGELTENRFPLPFT